MSCLQGSERDTPFVNHYLELGGSGLREALRRPLALAILVQRPPRLSLWLRPPESPGSRSRPQGASRL